MRVRTSKPALASIRRATAYYRALNPGTAERFKADMRSCRRKLGEHPEIGAATDEAGTRVVLSLRFRYLVYYEIAEDAVEILDVMAPEMERPRSGRP